MDLAVFRQSISLFASCADAEGALRILGRSARAMGADAVTIEMRQGDVCHCVHVDANVPHARGRSAPLNASLAGWCIRHRRHAAIADLRSGGDARVGRGLELPAAMQSVMTIPLPAKAPVAAISLYWARPYAASEEELQTLQSLGEIGVQLYLQLRRIEELQARLAGQERRLALAVHQLRAPLTPIRLALRLLHLRIGGPKVLDYGRGIIQRQVRHLTRLIGDLSDPAAGEALSLRPARMNLTRALSDLAADLRPALDGMQRALRLEVPSQPVWLHADPVRLNQAFLNLITNAAKAAPAGGEVRLSMSCSHAPRMVTVLVEDDGAGPGLLADWKSDLSIPASDLSWVEAGSGSGIGLHVARLIVEQHQGTLALDHARLNKGTRVCVRLPAEQAEEPLPGIGAG